jgi:hypothetical protein
LGAVLTLLIEGHPAWMSTVARPQKHELASALADHPGLRGAFTRFLDGLCALILQGQERGEFDPGIPAPIVARFLLSLTMARGGPSFSGDVVLGTEEYAALAVRFSFHGLAAHAAKEPSL